MIQSAIADLTRAHGGVPVRWGSTVAGTEPRTVPPAGVGVHGAVAHATDLVDRSG